MKLVIAGAGSIGCFVGGLLARGGHEVTLWGRERMLAPIRDKGLTLSDFSGQAWSVPPDRLRLATDPACLAAADLVIVCVKAGATAAIARDLAAHAPRSAPVISLQNGIGNADTLRAALPGRDVRAAMVPFNVVQPAPGAFHRASSGNIVLEAATRPLAAGLSVPHLPMRDSHDIVAVQWGKLLLNLTNALNALSGLTLRQQLLDRDWRRLMADQMAEALTVLAAAGLRPAPPTPLPARLLPWVLRLPTPVFTRIAARMLTIDAQARSSMSDDLSQGRPSEIDSLQGAIIALGQSHGVATPLCHGVADAVRRAQAEGPGLPGLSPADLRRGARP